MDLWIRSQNKEILTKVNNIILKENIILGNDLLLGEYSTKERAMEVLNEINNGLKILQKISLMKVLLYPMPKE
jgi:hypothetical protein